MHLWIRVFARTKSEMKGPVTDIVSPYVGGTNRVCFFVFCVNDISSTGSRGASGECLCIPYTNTFKIPKNT